MNKTTSLFAVITAFFIVGCPESDDPLQVSATEATSSSSSTSGPDETVSTSGEDPDTTTSTSPTSGSAVTLDSATDGDTTGDEYVCGDGIQDAGEQCDEGENNSEDGPCTPECTLTCGDGELQVGEECDLGIMNKNAGTCTKECKDARCGDKFIQPGETCDNGDSNSLDPGECNPETCTPNIATCGNNKLDDDEECDPSAPGGDTASCTQSCTFVSRIIFTTPEIYKADFRKLDLGDMNLSGLESADLLCQTLADEANLDHAETYIALLSTPDQPIGQRLGKFGGEYADTKPTRIAIGSEALLSGALEAPITRDHFGQNAMAENTFVWTGSLNSGASSDATCKSWEPDSPLDHGLLGKLGEASAKWLNDQEGPCGLPAHLYCVQNGS